MCPRSKRGELSVAHANRTSGFVSDRGGRPMEPTDTYCESTQARGGPAARRGMDLYPIGRQERDRRIGDEDQYRQCPRRPGVARRNWVSKSRLAKARRNRRIARDRWTWYERKGER